MITRSAMSSLVTGIKSGMDTYDPYVESLMTDISPVPL